MSEQKLVDKQMTFEEFKQYLEKELFSWISKRDRSLGAYLLSVEEWAMLEYNRTSKIEDERCHNCYKPLVDGVCNCLNYTR